MLASEFEEDLGGRQSLCSPESLGTHSVNPPTSASQVYLPPCLMIRIMTLSPSFLPSSSSSYDRVAQTGFGTKEPRMLELSALPVSASELLGLSVCTTSS